MQSFYLTDKTDAQQANAPQDETANQRRASLARTTRTPGAVHLGARAGARSSAAGLFHDPDGTCFDQ